MAYLVFNGSRARPVVVGRECALRVIESDAELRDIFGGEELTEEAGVWRSGPVSNLAAVGKVLKQCLSRIKR